MTTDKIGELAGRIWRTLDEEGELRIATLKKQVAAPDALVSMALGWLAREDKIEVTPDGRTFRVRLK
jgi:hypothetical protein